MRTLVYWLGQRLRWALNCGVWGTVGLGFGCGVGLFLGAFYAGVESLLTLGVSHFWAALLYLAVCGSLAGGVLGAFTRVTDGTNPLRHLSRSLPGRSSRTSRPVALPPALAARAGAKLEPARKNWHPSAN